MSGTAGTSLRDCRREDDCVATMYLYRLSSPVAPFLSTRRELKFPSKETEFTNKTLDAFCSGRFCLPVVAFASLERLGKSYDTGAFLAERV
jgi:hypothetical protein